ncbi:MAG TPA: acylphosphatase [Methyloceanibacter sp.]|nr:acylphosphatase [Methyloceanibacter sp.]
MREKSQSRRTVTVRIEGRVQGVYYRAWTYETALSLGLDGTVQNTADGAVEAVFSGPAQTVAKMLELCRDGPEAARVTKVAVLHEGGTVAPGFKVIAADRWR